MGNQGNRDRDKNLGRTGNDSGPTGTTGRTGSIPPDRKPDHTDTNRRPTRMDEEEDSGLGNRSTLR